MPKISIIIPIYNAGPYIEACLASIVAQTLDNIEVLLVDDHGCDDSMERARGLLTLTRAIRHSASLPHRTIWVLAQHAI